MAPRNPNIPVDVVNASITRRKTRSSAIEKPTPINSGNCQTSRLTSASSMDNFITSPIRKDSKSSPNTARTYRSKSFSPGSDETAETTGLNKATRKSSAKTSNNPVYEIDSIITDPLAFIQTPATKEELDGWKGWVELESEPVGQVVLLCIHHNHSNITDDNSFRAELIMMQAFFNVMLRDLGVEGVKIQEVFSLDQEMLQMIPKPMYGLIFLYQFKEDDPSQQESSCPEHIWFANQTTNNACATIALLNIIMNASGVDIGPTLSSLKDFSKDMTPAIRGYTVGSHDYIRRVHNSFARKMDMLVADLSLHNDMTASKAKAAQKSYAKKEKVEDVFEAGFHFVAFVPIGGNLWKLDGLERQPMNLGDCTDANWMDITKPIIEERMAQYEDDQIQFNLLAVIKSPYAAVKAELCENIHTIIAIQKKLCLLDPDWQRFFTDEEKRDHRFLYGPDMEYDITPAEFWAAQGNPVILNEVSGDTTISRLFDLHRQLGDRQKQLKMALLDEATEIRQDNETAASRRHDLTPMLNTWIAALAENEKLKALAQKYPGNNE